MRSMRKIQDEWVIYADPEAGSKRATGKCSQTQGQMAQGRPTGILRNRKLMLLTCSFVPFFSLPLCSLINLSWCTAPSCAFTLPYAATHMGTQGGALRESAGRPKQIRMFPEVCLLIFHKQMGHCHETDRINERERHKRQWYLVAETFL